MLLQAGAALAWAVVKYELVVAAGAFLALAHGLRFYSRQTGGMGVTALTSREPGGGVACRCARAFDYLVVLGILVAFAVVEAADDYWSVDVAFDKINEYFLTYARDSVAAPVGTGDRGHAGGDAYPGAGLFIGGGAGVAFCLRVG